MRDNTHMESIERWAQYVRTHKDWKKIHSEFINAQFEIAYRAIEKIAKMPNGASKIKQLYRIKNEKGYKKLLSKK